MIEGFKTQLDGKGPQAAAADRVLQPAALQRPPAGQRDDRRRGRADRLHRQLQRARSRRSPTKRDDLVRAGRQRQRHHGRDRGREPRARARRWRCCRRRCAAATATFVNLRSTLDDLDPLVADSKPATKDLAPFLRELRPLVHDAKPTIADLSTLVHRPGTDNDLVDATRKLPSFQKRRQPGPEGRHGRAAEEPAGARVHPARTSRSSSAGSATSARAPPTTTPTATTRASSRSSTPSSCTTCRSARRSSCRCRSRSASPGLQTGMLKRCPGSASQHDAGRLGAVPRLRRQPRLRPDPGAGRSMIRVVAIVAVAGR